MPSNTTKSNKKQDEKYAPTTWGGEAFEDLQVPSGQMCQVRRPGVQGLMNAGVLNSVDSLLGIVQNELIPQAEGKRKIDAKALLDNPEALAEIVHVADRIVTYVVMQPEIHMTPSDITNREAGLIYADMIDLEDKMFIMNFAVGGTRDLEQFRKESQEALGDLDNQPTATNNTKRASKAK